MATDKRKRAIRALADKRGISYTTAMRMHDADQEPSPRTLHPISPDYDLGRTGLDLSSPALVIGGEGSGKTVAAASIATQALQRGARIEFLSQGRSGLKGAEGEMSPEAALEHVGLLHQELASREAVRVQARAEALQARMRARTIEEESAPLPSFDSIMNEQGLQPVLVVDDDMPKAIRARSPRKQYLGFMEDVANQGADLGFSLVTTRTEARDAFLSETFLTTMGDVILLGKHTDLPIALERTFSTRGVDIERLKATTQRHSWDRGVVTYKDHYESLDLRPVLVSGPADAPIWDGNAHPDPLTFYLGTAPGGDRFSVTLRGDKSHLLICGGDGAGKSTLADQVVAQALSKPMPWDPALHALAYTLDQWGYANARWSERGANCASTEGLEGVYVRLKEIEEERQRRLKILSEHPEAQTWEDLPGPTKKSEHIAPIVVVMDETLDLLERPDKHRRSEEENESLRLLCHWRDEGNLTGIVLVLTSNRDSLSGAPNTYRVSLDSRRDAETAERLHSARMSDSPGQDLFLPMHFGPNADSLDRWLPPLGK